MQYGITSGMSALYDVSMYVYLYNRVHILLDCVFATYKDIVLELRILFQDHYLPNWPEECAIHNGCYVSGP